LRGQGGYIKSKSINAEKSGNSKNAKNPVNAGKNPQSGF